MGRSRFACSAAGNGWFLGAPGEEPVSVLIDEIKSLPGGEFVREAVSAQHVLCAGAKRMARYRHP